MTTYLTLLFLTNGEAGLHGGEHMVDKLSHLMEAGWRRERERERDTERERERENKRKYPS
jgi:hypothetical protein